MVYKKRKTSRSNISINGGVSGIGNVVGNHSKSSVEITPNSLRKFNPLKKQTNGTKFWTRLIAFLLTLTGILVGIGLFLRFLQQLDVLIVLEIILAALVTSLGVAGILKPKPLADLLSKLLGRK